MASNRASQQEIAQVRTALSIAFPDCIAPKGGEKKPLKIGIKKDLLALARAAYPDISSRLICAFLREYTSGFQYLAAVKKGAVRVDAHGNFSGFVTADEDEYSKSLISKKRRGRKPRASSTPEAKSIGDATSAIVLKASTALSRAKDELAVLEAAHMNGQMSDDFYYSNGRYEQNEQKIRNLKKEITDLEGADV